MKRLAPLFAALVLLFALGSSAAAQKVWSGEQITGEVTGIMDGDTYRLNVARSLGGVITVDLWGVDAPELGQPYGERARIAALRHLKGRTVRITVKKDDSSGRVPAHLAMGLHGLRGETPAVMLTRRGLAWRTDEEVPNDRQLTLLQDRAFSEGRGLWSQTVPVPPWEYRNASLEEPETSSEPETNKSCISFDTQPEAQRFFEAHQPGDPHNLDRDGDGQACESFLPGGP